MLRYGGGWERVRNRAFLRGGDVAKAETQQWRQNGFLPTKRGQTVWAVKRHHAFSEPILFGDGSFTSVHSANKDQIPGVNNVLKPGFLAGSRYTRYKPKLSPHHALQSQSTGGIVAAFLLPKIITSILLAIFPLRSLCFSMSAPLNTITILHLSCTSAGNG